MAKRKRKTAIAQPETPAVSTNLKKPQTPFEAAKTPLERLQISQGGNSYEMRPVHPTEVELKKKWFCDTYEIDKRHVVFIYDEGGMQLFAKW